MKNQIIIIAIMFLLLTSCSEMFKERTVERDDIIKTYNELKKIVFILNLLVIILYAEVERINFIIVI